MEKRDNDFLKTSAAYLVLGFIVFWILGSPRIFEMQITNYQTAQVDISLLRWSILALLCGFYLGRAAEYLLSGKWVKPLRTSLRYSGVLGFVYLLAVSPNSPVSLQYTSKLLLIGCGAMILLNLTENTYGNKHRLVFFSAKSLRYLVLGVTGALIITRIPEIQTKGLDTGFIVLGCLSAASVFLGYYEENGGGYSKYLGEKTRFSFITLVMISFYVTAYRQVLITALARSAGFIYFIEWIAICILGISYFKRYIATRKTATSELKGDWTRHIQQIETRSDSELERWNKLVTDFLNEGEKTLLILYIIDLYRQNGVSLEQISQRVKNLMNYAEPDEPIQLTHRSKHRTKKKREQREQVLNQAISAIQERIG